MPVQSHRNGWRARKKHAGQWFIGPVRQSVQAAEEDSRSLDEASAVSVEALRERCQNLATTNSQEKMDTVERRQVTVERRSAGWRLRVGTKENRRYGPTRKEKSAAEDDARRVADALQVSQQEVDRVLRQLTEDGSGLSDDFPLQHLKVCLGQLNPPALPRRQRERYRSEASKRENAGVMRACELLVSEYQLAESLASRIDARWLHDMGRQWRLDSGSRPLGTGGFDNAAPISGLRIWGAAVGSIQFCNVFSIVARWLEIFWTRRVRKVRWGTGWQRRWSSYAAEILIMWLRLNCCIKCTWPGRISSLRVRALTRLMRWHCCWRRRCPSIPWWRQGAQTQDMESRVWDQGDMM